MEPYIQRFIERLEEDLTQASGRMRNLANREQAEAYFQPDDYLQLLQIQRQLEQTKQMFNDFAEKVST